MRLIDVRASRFEQGLVVAILLAGFAFRQPWSIPAACVVATLGTVLGERSPVIRLWTELIASHRPPARAHETAVVARTQSLLLASGLALATGLVLAGAVLPASIMATVVAVIATLGASGIFSAAAELRRRADRT